MKTSPLLYEPKDPVQLVGRLAVERIHRAEAIELYALDRGLIAAVVVRLERRMGFAVTVDRELFLSFGTETVNGVVVRHPVA